MGTKQFGIWDTKCLRNLVFFTLRSFGFTGSSPAKSVSFSKSSIKVSNAMIDPVADAPSSDPDFFPFDAAAYQDFGTAFFNRMFSQTQVLKIMQYCVNRLVRIHWMFGCCKTRHYVAGTYRCNWPSNGIIVSPAVPMNSWTTAIPLLLCEKTGAQHTSESRPTNPCSVIKVRKISFPFLTLSASDSTQLYYMNLIIYSDQLWMFILLD